ncbi:MAG: tetratricopeptide repeat protein [Elusimicrobia bacterium]|nr:tetratricopeptide repeat protein [Elusimicrobiota bacterium]
MKPSLLVLTLAALSAPGVSGADAPPRSKWGSGLPAVAQASSPMDVAWNLLKEDQLERAISPLQEALKKTPTHALMRYGLGVCLAHTGESGQAEEELKLAAQMDPSFPQTWYYLRTVILSNGDPKGQEYFRRMASKNKKKNPSIHLNYGLFLLQNNQTEAALKQFQTAADLSAAYAEAHFQAGAALYDLLRWKEAVASLKKAVEIDPDYAEAKRVLALALEKAGEPADQIEAIRKQALALKPELAEAEEALTILSDKDKKANWEKNLERVGKLYLAPLKAVGIIMSPLVPFLEREPVGRAINLATSSRTAAGYDVPQSSPTLKGTFSKIAIKWTSSKHLEPLPLETLADPDDFTLSVRLGGKRLLWAFFTTPNLRIIAEAAGPGKAAISIRRIPPVQVRFDPNGSLVSRGDYAAGQEFAIDGQWGARVVDVGPDTVRLKISRKR